MLLGEGWLPACYATREGAVAESVKITVSKRGSHGAEGTGLYALQLPDAIPLGRSSGRITAARCGPSGFNIFFFFSLLLLGPMLLCEGWLPACYATREGAVAESVKITVSKRGSRSAQGTWP